MLRFSQHFKVFFWFYIHYPAFWSFWLQDSSCLHYHFLDEGPPAPPALGFGGTEGPGGIVWLLWEWNGLAGQEVQLLTYLVLASSQWYGPLMLFFSNLKTEVCWMKRRTRKMWWEWAPLAAAMSWRGLLTALPLLLEKCQRSWMQNGMKRQCSAT